MKSRFSLAIAAIVFACGAAGVGYFMANRLEPTMTQAELVEIQNAQAAAEAEPEQPVTPTGPPRSDITIRVTAGAGTVDDAALAGAVPDVLQPSDSLVSGTLEHVITANSIIGSAELWRWQQVGEDGITDICVMDHDSGNTTGGASCAIPPDGKPHAWTTSTTPTGQPTRYEVKFVNAPEEARWLVITSIDGASIVADVVNGASFASWTELPGEPLLVTALDESQSELWSMSFE